MSASLLRPLVPARFRRSHGRLSVEMLTVRHEDLVRRRQQLRNAGADPLLLEENRVEIARCQFELSHALIERHLVHPPAQTAAA
jgi:hypothetical protein